ncbi:tRNA 2'-phosphotransferase 1-like [Paramacrobiotus metropolitanus]|uniref:tRNA 2'-phosphotransferase 1-like n=1 Tax=Paramacrobiotus metropolitanus TaxID=2943436 RepID=UPI002445879E|nr:tRNA 2'-phosphotransferase 1-like [Paramacrobiotus metropolitanus]XP_055333935.1 tRNA 2'-phosphotransferase 1-like [Paramacrobiotus metropolitanus]
MSGHRHSGGSAKDPRKVRISKSLSWLLRHGAAESNLSLSKEGYARVDDILKLDSFRNTTLDDIAEIVASCPKQRFTLRQDSDGSYRICANQGHSIAVESLELLPITSPEQCPQAIHGTFSRHLGSIQQKGLLPMSRNHIHFSREVPSDDRAVSGIRPSCDVLIYLDVPKILAAGIRLFESANKVILSPGNTDRCIPPEFFAKIVHRDGKTRPKIGRSH